MRLIRLAAFIAPPLFAVAFVLTGYVTNGVLPGSLPRPVLIAVCVAALLVAGFTIVMGSRRGPFWAFVATTALAGMFVVGGACVLVLTVLGWRERDPDSAYRVSGFVASGVAVALLATLVVMGARGGAFVGRPLAAQSLAVRAETPEPDINVLLLDGYPRADVLAAMGFDNTPFLDGLRDRGFDVSDLSQSNYDRTPFSLLSMLSDAHIADIDALWTEPFPTTEAGQQRRVARALLDPPLFDALEDVGYRTRVLTSTIVHVPIGGADDVWSSGSMTDFEGVLLQRTPLAAPLQLVGFAMGQQRDHIRKTLAQFAAPAAPPSFTFAHVMAPHAPIVFNADGSPAGPPPCYPATCSVFDGNPDNLGMPAAEYERAFVGQLPSLNALVTDAVDGLIERDPDSVIVIVGDHGIARDDELVHFRNLTAVRTPGHPDLLGPSPTLINVLPTILNAYLDAGLDLQPDALYRGGGKPWLAVQEIDR